MGIADAASGPSDNAGKAKGGLDDAISAAIDASEPDDLAEHLSDDKPEAEAKSSKEAEAEDKIAGDEPSSEDAAKAKVKAPVEEETTTDPLSAPKHWPEADKQAFAKLTKEGQDIALKLAKNLEGGFTRKSQELSDKARFADSVRSLFDNDFRGVLQQSGLDEVTTLKQLVDLQKFVMRDNKGYGRWLKEKFGWKPEDLGFTQTTPQPSPTGEVSQDEELRRLLADPQVAELGAEVKSLKAIIDREERNRQQAATTQHVNAVRSLETTIKSVREALDDTGQLMYPHFDTVQKQMAALMDNDPDLAGMPDSPEKLQEAYDMAVWANPVLRQALVKAETTKEIQQGNKKRDALRAKSVTSVKPAAGVVSTKTKAASLDDTISQAMIKFGL